MTNYADLDELRSRIYFESATLDERFTWQEIVPTSPAQDLVKQNPGLPAHMLDELGQVGIRHSPTSDPKWADGFRRFRLVDCAHLEMYRDGALCTHCGHENHYEPPAAEIVRKKRGKR